MNAAAIKKVSVDCIRKGEECESKEIWGKAFSYFLLAVKLDPMLKDQLKTKFFDILCKYLLF